MKISILIDESFDIDDCEQGFIVALMIDEWWVFLKDDDFELIGAFETIIEARDFLSHLLN